METTRFPHALGSFHIAQRITNALSERQPSIAEGLPQCMRLTPRDSLAFSVAALLHDVGHGPLSHVWENCFSSHSHESMGLTILQDQETAIGRLLSKTDAHPKYKDIGRDVISFLSGQHRLSYLLPLLEGNLDADRLDFISRDTKSAGVTYGFHELEWIIRTFRFARLPARYTNAQTSEWIIAIDGRKGLSTLIQFLHARENMYRLVYHHKTTRSATAMLRLLFKRARRIHDRASLDPQAPTLECASSELYRALTMPVDQRLPTKSFLQLDDTDIWFTLKGWASGNTHDQILTNLAASLIERDLFKVFLLNKDVFDRLAAIDVETGNNTLRAMVKARVGCSLEDASYYYALDSTSFDVIGRNPREAWLDAWIMQSGALGFEFTTLRDYWFREVSSKETSEQYLLVVHRDVVEELTNVVERLSFPTKSAKDMERPPSVPDPYRLIAPLGREGAWKEVWAGINAEPGNSPEKIIALKRYKVAEIWDSIERDVRLVNLLASPHPNLSTAHVVGKEDGLWIVEPLWTGSLEELVKKHGPRRDILEIAEIAHHLFLGLSALHEHNLRHTDIKPDNCGIIVGHGAKSSYLLGDFGCLSSQPAQLPTDERLLGTLRTRAPEVIARQSISLASDVWAMAATVYALCLGEYPFVPFGAPHHHDLDRSKRETKLREELSAQVKDHRVRVSRVLPPILADQLLECFADPALRPGAKDAASAFGKILGDLVTGQSHSHRTAWQRAEDVVVQLERKQISRDAYTEEIDELIGPSSKFVPINLREMLERTQGTYDPTETSDGRKSDA
jgi:HD superfamily phosphohydrolase/serine/threonine protein kinase